MGLYKRKITISDDVVTAAVHLTLKQSLVPCFLGKSPLLLIFTSATSTDITPQSLSYSSSGMHDPS